MKKALVWALVFVLAAAAAFGLGFYTGRNTHSQAITVSAFPQPTETVAEATAMPAAIPTAVSTEASEATAAAEAGKIDINTATAAELTQISGIGEVLAQRIVDYREEHGGFTSMEELANVEGIGEKRLAAIMEAATIGG